MIHPPAGVFAAAPTLFHADGTVDAAKTLAIWQSLLLPEAAAPREHHAMHRGACDGLIVFGSTGEAHSIPFGERMKLLEAAAVTVAGKDRQRIWVGTVSSAWEEVAATLSLANTLGFAGGLLMPPQYYRAASPDGLLTWLKRVLDKAGDASVLLYHIPAMSGVPITHAMIHSLLEHEYPIVGLKDSSGDSAGMQGFIDAFPSLSILSGNELLLPTVKGGKGTISAVANITSPLLRAYWHRPSDLTEDDSRMAGELAFRIRRAVQGTSMIPQVKTWMAVAHGRNERDATPFQPHVAPPLTPVAMEQFHADDNGDAGNDGVAALFAVMEHMLATWKR